ncbi:PIN domain-containing protein [Bacillus ectoiniformans]|uniref:PIN domain-containing protein n=1 Tax=Bacillus ectoiniformans TaxID=1494429 RepID=UPI00195ED22B|nr:PIN domain-containing protein [Bacillus ectoiniformans]
MNLTLPNEFRSLSSSFASKIPKAFIDTTVLCGSLRKPEGVNDHIIMLARANFLFTPVFSKVCLLEFMRTAQEGLGKITFSHSEIERYLNGMIYPILDNNPAVNSVVGRYNIQTIIKENRAIGDVLVELSGCTEEEADHIVASQEMNEPLYKFDQNDFHVWVTAIQTQCDFIVTSNSKRFPERIGNIQRIHSLDFYNMIIGEDE